MSILRFSGIAVIAAVLAVTVRSFRPELGMQVAVAGGLIVAAGLIGELAGIAGSVRVLMESVGMKESLTSSVFKITGVAYTAQLAADICRDSGETALASKAEICGRLAILTCVLPMLADLLLMLSKLIGEFL